MNFFKKAATVGARKAVLKKFRKIYRKVAGLQLDHKTGSNTDVLY